MCASPSDRVPRSACYSRVAPSHATLALASLSFSLSASRAGESDSGAAHLSLGDRGLTRCRRSFRHRVPPPSPTQGQLSRKKNSYAAEIGKFPERPAGPQKNAKKIAKRGAGGRRQTSRYGCASPPRLQKERPIFPTFGDEEHVFSLTGSQNGWA